MAVFGYCEVGWSVFVKVFLQCRYKYTYPACSPRTNGPQVAVTSYKCPRCDFRGTTFFVCRKTFVGRPFLFAEIFLFTHHCNCTSIILGMLRDWSGLVFLGGKLTLVDVRGGLMWLYLFFFRVFFFTQCHTFILWSFGRPAPFRAHKETANKRRKGVCILSGLYTCVGYLLRSKDCGYYFTYKRCGLSFFPPWWFIALSALKAFVLHQQRSCVYLALTSKLNSSCYTDLWRYQ